jgi:ribosomal protein S18 acetylase RimI-like enzyme
MYLNSRRLESIYISALYIAKSSRGNGIGSALIQKVKFDYPLAKITVMTESNNSNALNFYLKTNWKVEARCHNTLLLTLDV